MKLKTNGLAKWFNHLWIILACLIKASLCAEAAAALKQPYLLYLTWQQDPTTTMTVQWINPNHLTANSVAYYAAGDHYWQQANALRSAIPGDERYSLHRVELTKLTPNTDYFFRIAGEEGFIYQFRTMPATSATPICFVVGGDIYHDNMERVRETNRQAALQSPWFALLGGDLAYGADKFGILPEGWQSWMERLLAKVDIASGKRQRWIDWLATWHQSMVTPEGRLIPLIPALGNHDVNGGFGKTAEDAALFHTFFPFPGKKGYQCLDFGKYLSVIVLDSGHTNPIGGEQTRWLYEALRWREEFMHKFALYHVPAYPSVRAFNGKISSEVRHFWVPLFSKFDLTAAFEHHDHAYKRSHPLRLGKIDPKGVVFFGDGAWGVEEPRAPASPHKRWYLAHTAAKNHFIKVMLNGPERHFTAIDPKGNVFDELHSRYRNDKSIR